MKALLCVALILSCASLSNAAIAASATACNADTTSAWALKCAQPLTNAANCVLWANSGTAGTGRHCVIPASTYYVSSSTPADANTDDTFASCSSNCNTCSSGTSCTTCADGFALTGTAGSQTCAACNAACTTCTTAADSTKCIKCATGYTSSTGSDGTVASPVTCSKFASKLGFGLISVVILIISLF